MAIAAELDKDNPKIDHKRTLRASLLLMFAGFFVFFIVAIMVFLGLIRFLPD
jgi:Sec-independent protein secretion pathway component TatC